MNAEENNTPSNWEIMFGGRLIEVDIADQEKCEIRKERVKVKKIRLASMGALGTAYGKIPKEAAEYLRGEDIPEKLIEQMTDESLMDVVTVGRALNSKSFAAWFKLQTETAQMLTGKSLDETIEAAIKSAASQAAK